MMMHGDYLCFALILVNVFSSQDFDGNRPRPHLYQAWRFLKQKLLLFQTDKRASTEKIC
jgi:hypothetical protein